MTIYFNKSSQLEKRKLLRKRQTSSEKILWTQLRDRRFHKIKFRRQYSVASYVIDFYCPETKTAVEIDGGIHLRPDQIQHDKLRQEQIEGLGIKFLRFSVKDVETNLEIILELIATFCKSDNL
ncbi:MAG: hypothetical protein UW68_C0015G0029 [Candidatus Collierbacteria bacterium GW2011_GWB1_44_6]|uniref:DUF559 domain-containing protein n=1 Tax=Candidatus Collierbacteria bacterium GW2011_GWB1_44_6 TaxID=1618384 RepID=A0A0G1JNU4_9BACT|nr:MAG: hypothetical protein UW68_C0015G0029 [Candidatus Collierbacteria bacterium GW2011_GWB1_44_6]